MRLHRAVNSLVHNRFVSIVNALGIPVSDVLAWIAVAMFVTSALLASRNRRYARTLGATAWVVFGVFWLSLFNQFFFEMKSFIEGALSLLALPACLYAGYLLYSGRDSLFTLTRAVAVMGVVYLPFETVFLLRQFLVETVTQQTEWGIQLLGYHPTVTTGPNHDFRSMFVFTNAVGHRFTTHIVLACTGLGSMAIFGGLIAAVRAPLRRKLQALAVVIPAIWALNIVRNVFIALAFGNQWFQVFVDPIMRVVGYEQPGLVSFFIADRVIAQSLSVVALIAITWFVVRKLPELLTVVEDVAYIVTGNEYDFGAHLDNQPIRADGR